MSANIHSDTKVTKGLINAIAATFNALGTRDLTLTEIQEALKELRESEIVQQILFATPPLLVEAKPEPARLYINTVTETAVDKLPEGCTAFGVGGWLGTTNRLKRILDIHIEHLKERRALLESTDDLEVIMCNLTHIERGYEDLMLFLPAKYVELTTFSDKSVLAPFATAKNILKQYIEFNRRAGETMIKTLPQIDETGIVLLTNPRVIQSANVLISFIEKMEQE